MRNTKRLFLSMMMGMVLVSGAFAQEEDEGISIEYSDADLAAVDKIKEAGALVL